MPVSDLSKVNLYGQISCPDLSDHDMIYISYNLPRNVKLQRRFYYRDFKSFNLNYTLQIFYDLSWNQILSLPNIDYKVECLNDKLQNLYDKCVPQKRFVESQLCQNG